MVGTSQQCVDNSGLQFDHFGFNLLKKNICAGGSTDLIRDYQNNYS